MPDPVLIDDIDKKISLERTGSQGQTLAAIYAFVTSLLDRSNHQFPLIVDHPFEGLQVESRDQLSKILPSFCHQYIGFLINSEKLVQSLIFKTLNYRVDLEKLTIKLPTSQ